MTLRIVTQGHGGNTGVPHPDSLGNAGHGDLPDGPAAAPKPRRLLLLHAGVAAVAAAPGVLIPMPGVHPRLLHDAPSLEPA